MRTVLFSRSLSNVPQVPGSVTANNIGLALDEPLSARVLLMNEKRLSRMARVERGF